MNKDRQSQIVISDFEILEIQTGYIITVNSNKGGRL